MNIFVAGASGLVGAAFVAAAAKQGHRVSGTFGSFDGSVAGLDKMLRVDLMDAAAVSRAVAAEKPEAIVNCAAVSVPEACEADPERAERLNIELPATLAGLANSRGARFVHLSSEQVFDGKSREPYRREDSVSPINLYGREKLRANGGCMRSRPASR